MIESSAMLMYAGELSGLVPTSPLGKARVIEVIQVIESMATKLTDSFTEKDQEKKLAMRKKFLEGPLTSGLKYLESKVSEKKLMVGDSLTIADLKVAGLIQWLSSGTLDGITKDDVKSYLKLISVKDAVEKRMAQ